MHINDFIQSFDLIFRKGKNLQIYNLGTNEKIRIKDLANLLLKKFKKRLKIKNSKSFEEIPLLDVQILKKLGD